MIPKNRKSTHPGEILAEEFLAPLGVTQVKLAAHLGIPVQRINEIVKGRRGISAATAWLLAAAFGTSPEFWTNAQSTYDLSESRPTQRILKMAAG